MRSIRMAFGVLVVAALGMLTLHAQSAATKWETDPSITTADRAAILALAKQIGIEPVRRVSFRYPFIVGCPVIAIESGVLESDYLVTWTAALVRLRGRDERGRQCSAGPGQSRRRGRWGASRSEVSAETRWRITDGDWHVDVRYSADATYRDAEQIVVAIRRGQLVNRLPGSLGALKLDTTIPDINADEIIEIDRVGAMRGGYDVRTGIKGGIVLRIVVAGDTVELHGVLSWLVLRDRPPDRPLHPTPGAARASPGALTRWLSFGAGEHPMRYAQTRVGVAA